MNAFFKKNSLDYSGRIVPPWKRCSHFQEDEFLDKIVFKGNIRNGFFIEAGADDFLLGTNTLLFEEKYNWTGLLIEPHVNRFQLG